MVKAVKKLIFFLISLIISPFIFICQDLTSKHGEPILPEAKDWAIGIDATKLLSKQAFDYISTSQMFYAKYFLKQNLAYRFGLRTGFNSQTSKYK